MEETLNLILRICCEYFDVPEQKIKSRDRHKKYSVPRHIYNYLSRKFTNCTLRQIGDLINRDHTSVCHSIDYISDCFFTKQEPFDHVLKLQLIVGTELEKNVIKVIFTFNKQINWNLFTTNITDNYGAIKYEIIESKIYNQA